MRNILNMINSNRHFAYCLEVIDSVISKYRPVLYITTGLTCKESQAQ